MNQIISRIVVLLIILIFFSACQETTVPPTLTTLPIETPITLAEIRPTQTPRPITALMPTAFPSAAPTSTPPSMPTAAIISTLAPPPLFTDNLATLEPDVTPSGTPVLTRLPAVNTFVIGQSARGRDILAWRFGTGDKILLLVGGVHAGFESNTVLLINALIDHFEATPMDVLPDMSVIFIPVLNPDGLARGRTSEGRFNGNQVDLNRNWGCDWSATAYWQQRTVDPGERPFSEPETAALSVFMQSTRPVAALFYHAAANGIFEGTCNDQVDSLQLAAVLSEASGYPYGEPFDAYTVSGTAANWADGQGILSADVELAGTRDTEFKRNLRGILAIQCWITGRLDLPQCSK